MFCGMASSNDERTKRSGSQNSEQRRVIKKYALSLSLVVILLVLGGILIYYGEKNLQKQYIDFPKSCADLKEFLKENSNYSDIVDELDFDDYWPSEYFEINLKGKKISYWKDTTWVAEVMYENVSGNSTLKEFADTISQQCFREKFPSIRNIEELVTDKYRQEIKNSRVDVDKKNLSFLYNALAGHPGSYILLGRGKDQDEWRYYTPDDFLWYSIQINEELYRSLSPYTENSSQRLMELSSLNRAISNVTSSIVVKAISFDFRGDKIWYGNDSVKATKETVSNLKAPYDFLKLNGVSACGWIVPDEGDEMCRAKDYFRPSENVIFICDETYGRLSELKWNERDESVDYSALKYWGVAILSLGLGLGVLLIILVKYKKSRSNHDCNDCPKESTGEDTRHNDDCKENNSGEESEESPSQAKAIDEFKRSKEFKELVSQAKSKAVNEFKQSKEFEELVSQAKSKAVNEFKQSKEFEEIETQSRNWVQLYSCTSEGKVLAYLSKMHKGKESFPVIRTLASIYDEVGKSNSNKESQIAAVLEVLDRQLDVNGRLKNEYDTLTRDAKYAKEVRVYFENCKKIVQIYGERDEYKQIVLQGKDLTIWERMAVMLWAMGCANELFKAFGKNHLSSDIMSKAEAIHKEDIMQIFATRIFKKYINEPSVTPGMLAKSRDKMMKEKLLEMYSKYKISMSETSAYKTFVHELDDVYDRVKGNAVFIRIMKEQFVDEFVKDEREIQDEGRYLSLLVAMGLHMSDYVRFMSGNDIDYCPNMKFVLSGLNVSQLEANTEFRYKDPAYSGEYSNRVYGWLDSVGVKHLKALVGNKLIMP